MMLPCWRHGRIGSIGNGLSVGSGSGCGVVVVDDWTLTAADRCDGCASGAERAYVRVVDPVSWRDVLLCKHHFEAHEQLLLAQEFAVFDERGQLDVQLDASA